MTGSHISITNLLSTSTTQRDISPQFWNELQAFLESLFGPAFNPIVDAFRDEAFRSLVLSTIIIVSLFIASIIYVIYEVPSIFGWLGGGMNLSSYAESSPPPKTTTIRKSAKQSPQRVERPAEKLPVESVQGVNVLPVILKTRDEVILTVDVANNSGHKIEMVVVDIDLPDGIAIMTGSFRMQRIGTIETGDS
ncbi:MAG: hypothetical protein P1Q69_18220, partial [Candidatus Thorarchaeota archaeon]|nr:hypothetical protein [Candidatus Thorarchaeota archaeon]